MVRKEVGLCNFNCVLMMKLFGRSWYSLVVQQSAAAASTRTVVVVCSVHAFTAQVERDVTAAAAFSRLPNGREESSLVSAQAASGSRNGLPEFASNGR